MCNPCLERQVLTHGLQHEVLPQVKGDRQGRCGNALIPIARKETKVSCFSSNTIDIRRRKLIHIQGQGSGPCHRFEAERLRLLEGFNGIAHGRWDRVFQQGKVNRC